MRVGVRKGRIFIMDFVSVINENGKVVFFVGYFYIGKSMIFVLVFFEGFFFLSIENIVVDVRDGRIFVIGGIDVLVYDLKIEEIYGIKVEY